MEYFIDQCDEKQVNETGIAGRGAKSLVSLSVLLLAICLVPVIAHAGNNLKTFFQQNCSRCHGPDGSGISEEGKKLSGQDLTDPDWQHSRQDDKMIKVIMKGKFFGLAMPGFKDSLTEDEAQQMVTDIIRKSKKGQVIAPGSARGVSGN